MAGFVTAARVVLTALGVLADRPQELGRQEAAALKNAVERNAARTPGSGGELSHHQLKMFADTAWVPVFGKDGE